MADDQVEGIAREMWEASDGRRWPKPWGWDHMPLARKDSFRAMARAAIRAIEDRRFPTTWAYFAVCRALEKHRARADQAEARVRELERQLRLEQQSRERVP